MRFRLRTLLIVLAVAPPLLAGVLAGMWYAIKLWPGVVVSALLFGLAMCLHALRNSENR